ncbi:hypothetical protein MDA_GLEAN10024789 [Myotis davidii]|uniref:Uncharacterized protein n=1 Tax=Myotis davidii TaxID=225400 RepID=L5LZC1_MYODS|nr:hypothetical protein MDA_GLEAN10024789 [Myotis davidii]
MMPSNDKNKATKRVGDFSGETGCLDLAGEGSRSEVAGKRSSSSGSSKLQRSSRTSIPGPQDMDISEVFNGNSGTSN